MPVGSVRRVRADRRRHDACSSSATHRTRRRRRAGARRDPPTFAREAHARVTVSHRSGGRVASARLSTPRRPAVRCSTTPAATTPPVARRTRGRARPAARVRARSSTWQRAPSSIGFQPRKCRVCRARPSVDPAGTPARRGRDRARRAGPLASPIQLTDIRGDLHLHTMWSDGRDSTQSVVWAARAPRLRVSSPSPTTRRPPRQPHAVASNRSAQQAAEIDALRRPASRAHDPPRHGSGHPRRRAPRLSRRGARGSRHRPGLASRVARPGRADADRRATFVPWNIRS